MSSTRSSAARPARRPSTTRGRAAVDDALTAAAQLLAPGGAIIITDDVLPEEEVDVRVGRPRQEIADLVRRIEREYPSRPLEIRWIDELTFEIPARTFITLLTQYNKPKAGDEARWAVEQMEVHEYMKVSEYDAFMRDAGLTSAHRHRHARSGAGRVARGLRGPRRPGGLPAQACRRGGR